jgi:very-short-patch-repair endonuclease
MSKSGRGHAYNEGNHKIPFYSNFMNNPKLNLSSVSNIIIGQKITSTKHEIAKELRRNMTPEEKILWQYIRNNRLNGLHFRRQQIIDGFIVDFYCHAVGLVVEVDGEIHEQQVEYDLERDKVISSRGLCVLRVKNEDVRNNLDEVLRWISQAGEKTSP